MTTNNSQQTVTGNAIPKGNKGTRQGKKQVETVTGIITDGDGNPINEGETVPVYNGKGEVIRYYKPSLLSSFLSFVGTLLNDISGACEFYPLWPIKTAKVKVPALGAMGAKERATRTNRAIMAALTDKVERDEPVTNANVLTILNQYKAKGWKFTTYTKTGIMTVCNERVKNVAAKVTFFKEVANKCPELSALIKDTGNWKAVTKTVKDKGLPAAKDEAQKLLLSLPVINL